MSDFDRFLQRIIVFDPALSATVKDQERFLFCIKTIMQRYIQQLNNSQLFSKLQKLTVTSGSNPALHQNNAIGIDEFQSHQIYVAFFDDPNFDSSIDGHELAHEALNYLLGAGDVDANNLVHYAYNLHEADPSSPYVIFEDVKYHNWRQFFAFDKKTYQYRLSYANLALLLKDRDKIRAEIKVGTAPLVPNHYWPYPPGP